MYSNKRQILEALDAVEADPSLPVVQALDCHPAALLTLLDEGKASLDGRLLRRHHGPELNPDEAA